MEYLILGAGTLFLLKKKKIIKLDNLSTLPIFNLIKQRLLKTQYNTNREIEFLKKSKNNQEQQKEVFNKNIRVVSFNSVSDLNKINIDTDENLFGGDSTCEMKYNLNEDACIKNNINSKTKK
jgi:hypothetical protein